MPTPVSLHRTTVTISMGSSLAVDAKVDGLVLGPARPREAERCDHPTPGRLAAARQMKGVGRGGGGGGGVIDVDGEDDDVDDETGRKEEAGQTHHCTLRPVGVGGGGLGDREGSK